MGEGGSVSSCRPALRPWCGIWSVAGGSAPPSVPSAGWGWASQWPSPPTPFWFDRNRLSWGPTLRQDVSKGRWCILQAPGALRGLGVVQVASGGRPCQVPQTFFLWASWITGAAGLVCGWRGPGSFQSALLASCGRNLIPSTWGGGLVSTWKWPRPSFWPFWMCGAQSVGTGWAWAPPCGCALHRPACPHPHMHTLPTGPAAFLPLAL